MFLVELDLKSFDVLDLTPSRPLQVRYAGANVPYAFKIIFTNNL